MKIQFNTYKNKDMPVLDLALGRHLLLPAVLLSLLIIAASLVVERVTSNRLLGEQFSELEHKAQISELSQKVAILDAESERLKAFAKKMADIADVDISVFAFDQPPSQGGSSPKSDHRVPQLGQLDNDIRVLDRKMMAYSSQLERVQLILKSRVLGQEESLSQWPMTTGYISSQYGWRKDPFNGALRRHRGIDIAAKRGTPVMSVAAGKVVFRGRKGGYGRVVEIDHGKGVVSRYAHLESYAVSKGDRVKVGEKIATVGSSGRSTGPHLHLEILNDKQHVNPAAYLGRNDPLLSVNNK